MLDWMKDKLGRKQSPLQALVAGAFKDDEEKRALLELLGAQDKLKAEELVPLLGHADPQIQARASSLFLARATAAGVTEVLGVAVADPNARPALIRSLARVKAELVRGGVDALLHDAKAERLQAAWELAMDLPPEVADPYADRAFKEGSPKARHDALRWILARNGPPEGVRAALRIAVDDRDRRVRRLAVDALVKLEGKEVFEALLDRMRDDDAEIRSIASAYLQKSVTTAPPELRPMIIGRLLLSGDAELRAKLVRAMFVGDAAGALLLEVLTFAKTVLGAQHTALLDALKSLGDEIAPHALRLIEHADADVRVQAIQLLERLGNAKAAAAGVKLLGDPDWWVRIMACETLGRLKDPRTLPNLEKLLGDPDCKWAAIEALGTIGGESAFASLLGLQRDAQAEVRLAAMTALVGIDDRRVEGYLEQISKTDASVDVRVRAVDLLRSRRGGIGGGNAVVSHDQLSRPMEKLLAFAREAGASDLHVTPNEPPFLRVHGVLSRVEMKPLSRAQVDDLVEELLDPARKPILEARGAVDFCYAIAGVGRYRVNVFRQLRGTSAAVRVIPNATPTIASLGLPKSLEEIGTYHQGLVLIAGAAGCGKSTTLTALVNILNETRQTHVLTLEDPIEFLHTPKKALVNQRQVGRDTKTFAAAMRGALREDPDVIVIGELRDRETVRLAMVAAETGHLVIATMQTTSAVATVDKIVESFPTDEQQQIRVQLAGSLKLVISQMLVPRASGKGRVGVYEVLKGTSPVRALIREGKSFQIGSAMQMSRGHDMITLDGALETLLAQGQISHETAVLFAQRKDAFAKKPAGAAPAPIVAQAAAAAPPPPATPAMSPPKGPPAFALPPVTPSPMIVTAPEPKPTARRSERPRASTSSADKRPAASPRNSRPPGRPSRRMAAQNAPKIDVPPPPRLPGAAAAAAAAAAQVPAPPPAARAPEPTPEAAPAGPPKKRIIPRED